DPWADGAWAPPGRYSVVLTVDGASLTQPLTVVPDPRLALPPAAYAAQLALARRIDEAQGRLAAAAKENKALLAALAERRKGAKGETAKAVDALQARALDLAGGAAWRLPPKTLTSLRAVGDELGRLALAVDNADAAPSPDAVTGFEREQPALAAVLAAWEGLKTKDLAALNARLKRAGEPAIALEPGARTNTD